MTNQLSQIKWGRVILTAFAVYIASFVAVFLIITAYASSLAFQARGAPDQTLIQAFADQYAPWIGPISLILFTIVGAMWMVRRVETAIQLHGVILGVLASIMSIIFSDSFGLRTYPKTPPRSHHTCAALQSTQCGASVVVDYLVFSDRLLMF